MSVEEAEEVRGVEELVWATTGRSVSGWLVDVWNCRGVLKPCGFEGYGNQDDGILRFLEEQRPGMKHRWEDVGWFTIPVPANAVLTRRQRRRINSILAEEVERLGAINQSGFYPVSKKAMEKLERPGTMDRYWILWDWVQLPTVRREVLVRNPSQEPSGVHGVEIARRLTGEDWKRVGWRKLPPQSVIEAAPRVRATL